MNNSSIIVFFHGYGSSPKTDKFTSIQGNKICELIDYDEGLSNALEKGRCLIDDSLKKYAEVILAGHSMGGFVALFLAHEYNLKVMAIAPCVYPHLTRPNLCDVSTKLRYARNGVRIIVENDDEVFDIPKQQKYFSKAPTNYSVHYYDGGHHRINRAQEINEMIADLK